MLSESGGYLHCCAGANHIYLLKTADLSTVAHRKNSQGPLYGTNFLSGRIRGADALFWHRDGLVYSDPDHGKPEYECIFYERSHNFMGYGPERGCDTDGERIFYNLEQQLILLPFSPCNADELPLYHPPKPLEGKLTYHRETLIAAERAKGILQVCDISDLRRIKTLQYIHTNASCEKPTVINDRILIPGWYAGLLELI